MRSLVALWTAIAVVGIAVFFIAAVHPADKPFQKPYKPFREHATEYGPMGKRVKMRDLDESLQKRENQRAREVAGQGEGRYKAVTVIMLYENVNGRWVFRGYPAVQSKGGGDADK